MLVQHLQQQIQTLQARPVPVINIPENTIFRMPAAPGSDSRIDVAKPPVFSGKMEEVDAFIAGCQLYIQLKMRGKDDMDKIYWVLSYMQAGYAQDWRENMLAKYEDFMDENKPETVDGLFQLIRKDFGDLDEVATKIGKLRTMNQNKLTCDEHVQHFKKTARGTGYEGRALIEEFKRSLNAPLRKRILEGDTTPTTILGWFERATRLDRQWRQAKVEERYYAGRNSNVPTVRNKESEPKRYTAPPQGMVQPSRPPFWSAPARPNPPANATAGPNGTTGPLPPGVPMDIDRTTRKPFTCYKCGKPGHMARNCNSRLDMRQVRGMNVDQLTEYIRSMNVESSKDGGNQEDLA